MAQLIRKTPFDKPKTKDLGGHEFGSFDFSPTGSKFDKNIYLRSTSKTPKELADKIEEENNYYDTYVKTPLDDFQHFEQAMYTGFDPYNLQGRYGIAPSGSINRTSYQDLINAFGKSRGKFASQANDPAIKKYVDEQLAYRNGIYDRVRKIPGDKLQDFAYGYGFFADPFDYEDDAYNPPKDVEDFLTWFDYSPEDWSTLEEYLKEKGY